MTIKVVPQLNAEGYFVGFSKAQESPLEDGVFLIPGGAVDAESPPEFSPSQRAKFADGHWSIEDIPVPPPEPVEVKPLTERDYISALDAHLNAPAMAKGYDNIHSAALRAGYPGPFHTEGLEFATWMDACYAAGYSVLAQVKSGTMEQPSVDEFIAMLPALKQ